MQVRYLDLSVKDEVKRRRLLAAVEKVLVHGRILLGPEIEEFEKKIAEYCGVQYAVGVNSGTDAIYFALRSAGIGPGDEVITTCLSWIATANAIMLTGATPVFVDVRENFNIDSDKIEPAVTSKTKAIVPVHFTGKICDMAAIQKVASRCNLMVIEDAAQAFGAMQNGQKAGSFGVVSAFSMNPMKVFAACGEAGMVVTNDHDLYEVLLALRYNGTPDRVNAHYLSLNGRLDTIQAAILLERFADFPDDIRKRRQVAEYYSKHLNSIIKTPTEANHSFDVYYTYNTICSRRDALQSYLTNQGIETKIHHNLLMPDHQYYQSKFKGNWPTGEFIAQNSLCLPIHEKLTQAEQDYVINSIRQFYNQ